MYINSFTFWHEGIKGSGDIAPPSLSIALGRFMPLLLYPWGKGFLDFSIL
jgi:hypothetical protein